MQNLRAANGHAALDSAPDERRRHKRKPVLWKGLVETGAGAVECVILDLSAGGAKLLVSASVVAEAKVRLVIDRFGPLDAEVVWTRAGRMGLRFTAPPETIARTIGPALPLAGR